MDELNSTTAKDFPQQLEDFLAEVLAVRKLKTIGYKSFQAVVRSEKDTPDFYASDDGGQWLPVEVKHLRLTNSADRVVLDFFKNRPLNLALTGNSDAYLDKAATKELLEWLSGLDLQPAPYKKVLADGSEVNFEIGAGPGTPRIVRFITLEEDTSAAYAGLLKKAVRKVKEEVLQKSSILTSSRAIVAMRWSVPPGSQLDILNFRDQLKQDLEREFSGVSPKLVFCILHDWE